MPDWKAEVRARLSSVPLAPVREAEIVEELSQHLEDRCRELVAGGADPEDATRLTLAEFSGRDVLARHLATLRQAHWTDPAPVIERRSLLCGGVLTDLRDGVRALRAAPGFTVVALLVLVLGIGASTAIFSVVDAVVLRGLPFEDPDRLVAVGERSMAGKRGASVRLPPGMVDSGDPQALSRVQPQNYIDWVAQQQVFEVIAAIADLGESTLRVAGSSPETLVSHRVTASFFDVLRIRPAMGRAFTAENERDGHHRVAILSDDVWRHRFGGRSDIIGRTLPLDDGDYEVIGIMPRGVTYPVGVVRPPDLWVPYVIPPHERMRGRGHSLYLQCIARLKPGVSITQAQADMDHIATALERANPVWNQGTRVGVRPLRDHLVGASTRSWMLMLLTAVGIVQLIAAANVANLLLARASAREREVAVRAALGAGRWRLIRQFMIESLLLSAAGTVLSILGAAWAVGVLRHAMPDGVPRVTTIGLHGRVFIALAGLSIATGVFFGIIPAAQLSTPNLATSLNHARASAGRPRQRLRRALVVGEVALALVLLVGATLFLGSFISVMRIDPGFNPDRLLTMQVFRPPMPGPSGSPDMSVALTDIVDRLRQTRRVVAAAAVSPGMPLTVRMRIDGLAVRGRTIEGETAVSIKVVTPEYHQTMRIPLKKGRLFDTTDTASGAKVVVVSESVMQTFFAGDDPVGRSVVLDGVDRTVVGVVGNVHQWNLESETRPEVYLPLAQGRASSGYLVIRTSVEPYDVLPVVRAAVWDVLPNVPLRYVTTMTEVIDRQTAQRRLNMLMLALFGMLGLVISAVGVYGVLAYVVSQRTREIGVRMALGATRANVIGMVVMNASGLLGAGLIIGTVAAWGLGSAAKAFLFGLDAHDPRALVAAMVVLSAAGLIASAIPARRAATVDPTVALRSE